MEKIHDIKVGIKKNTNIKLGAKIALTLMMLNVIWQLAAIYRTRYQLVSPLIPESAIWEINKRFVFQAILSASVSIGGQILYFFDKYLYVMTLVVLALLTSRFIYV